MQVIPNTSGFFKIKKSFQNGFIFNYSKIFNKNERQAYSSIDDNKIRALIEGGYRIKSMTGNAGDILMIDTASLIHRAKPCDVGKRYLLACYYPAID